MSLRTKVIHNEETCSLKPAFLWLLVDWKLFYHMLQLMENFSVRYIFYVIL